MTDGFLHKVYDARDAEETRKLYDDWSASYEAEVGAQGYATPGRCAEALKDRVTQVSAPILDFGCGTGLSGLALKLAGFEVIDGIDLSADMLKVAAQKNIYRVLSQIEAGDELSHAPGDYAAIAAIGVIGAGAAPVSVFDTMMKGLAPGGLIVLSFNDHALADPIHEDRLQHHIDAGFARLLFKEYGDHLPGLNLKSNVYVIEKL